MQDQDFTPQELEAMIVDKTKENVALMEEVARLQKQLTGLELRSLRVHEENQMIKASPEIAAKVAEMRFELEMAANFIKSGAFPKSMTPEQAYTIIRAGSEMGLKPVESLNTLYIVNGAVQPYGKNMIGRLTSAGYRVEYLNEKPGTVDVRVFHPETGFDVTETATAKDQALRNSKALGFSEKNKLRFHGIRMIVNFHLPHLFASVADLFQSESHDFDQEQKDQRNIGKVEFNKQRGRIAEHITNAKTVEALQLVAGHVDDHDLREEYDAKMIELRPKIATKEQELFS